MNRSALLRPLLVALGVMLGARAAFGAEAEAQLRRALADVTEGRLHDALGDIDALIGRYPNFRLAYLVRGDVLLAHARPIGVLGNAGPAAPERLEALRAEALARLQALRERPPAGAIPRELLVLPRSEKHAIVVDASRARVYVYENDRGVPRLVADYYGTLGKQGVGKQRQGDQKTPLGIYHVTSSIPGRKLPDLYGWGAFPLNYPNEWDRRTGRTGYGIWLHGVPSENYARAPRASDGCIALANDEIAELARRVHPGATPVVIAERGEWLSADAWRAEREVFLRDLEAWRRDWESRDSEKYLSHYARGFRAGRTDLAAWSADKRKANAAKRWIKVALLNESVLSSGPRERLIEVTFDQDYRSNNVSQRARKRQFWIQEEGRWKVAYESTVSAHKLRLPESFKTATKGARS